MSSSNRISRRAFVCGLTAAAAAAPHLAAARALGASANEKIGVGLIGCGGMGMANLDACARDAGVAVTGVCDVQKSRRDRVERIDRAFMLLHLMPYV